jgi:hypothetical protein
LCIQVPFFKEQGKGVVKDILWIDELSMNGTIEDQRWNLQKADLKRVGGSNLHGQCDVTVHGEGNGVLGRSALASPNNE